MPELEQIRTRIDELARTLKHLAGENNEICDELVAGVAVGARPTIAELEEVRAKAEDIRRDLAVIKNRGRLDPEVRDLENKLEQVLNRYYWLWQKCKENMA